MRMVDTEDEEIPSNGNDLTASEKEIVSTPVRRPNTLEIPKKDRRFTVTPVDLSSENHSVHLHTNPMTPQILINDCDELNRSRTSSISSSIHSNYDPYVKVALLTTPSTSQKQLHSNLSENGVPSSLAKIVYRERKISTISQHSTSSASRDPFAQLKLVPHGATIPPLHLTNPLHKQMLNNLLRESERNLHFGTTDGRKVTLYAEDSSQLIESGSLKEKRWDSRGERISPEDERTRPVWDSKLYFILSCIGSCVGLGSFWRLPYLCLVHGRAAFLVPYLIIFFTSGIPLMLAEVAIGQFTQRGPVQAFHNICPLMKGVGVGLLLSSLFSSVYFSLLFSECVLSLEMTLNEPQASCNASRLLLCSKQQLESMNLKNSTMHGSMNMHTFNQIEPDKETYITVLGALLISWILVFLALRKSVSSIGKMTRVTATLPFILISAFVVKAVTLPGANSGLQYLFTPDWSVLRHGEVWANAAVQVVLSLNIGLGSSITFSSYNKYANNFTTDVWIVSFVSCMSTLLAVLMVFSSIGNIVHELGIDIENVNFRGIDLAFVVYPRILLRLPQKHIWTAVFFLLLLVLSLDSQLATAEVLVTSLSDCLEKMGRPNFKFEFLNKFFKNHKCLAFEMCFICMIFSLPFVLQGHEVVPYLNDFEEMNVALLFLTTLEIVTLVWLYGTNRLQRLILQVTSRPSSKYYFYCWRILTPISFIAFFIMSVATYDFNSGFDFKNGSSRSAFLLSFGMAIISLIPVPLYAIYSICKAEGSFREKLIKTLTPKIEIKNLRYQQRKGRTRRFLEWSTSNTRKLKSGKWIRSSIKNKINTKK